MSTALVDSGYLYAIVDQVDSHHRQVIRSLERQSGQLILPVVALTEVGYLVQARLGHEALRQLLRALQSGPLRLEPTIYPDRERMDVLLERYADLRLDFVAAAVVTIAERLNVQRILTVDQRDFRVIRPVHCDYFELVPLVN